MKRLVAVLCVVLTAAAAPGTDEPRALITRALDAVGGADKHRPLLAAYYRQKGTLHEGELDGLRFTNEALVQFPGQFRTLLQTDWGAEPLIVEGALNREKGWDRDNGEKPKDVDSIHLLDKQQSSYIDLVASLVPLLDEKHYQLSLAPEISINGKAAVGVLVRSPGQLDVKLYFSKDQGYLVKREARRKDPTTMKEYLSEEYLTDYQELSHGAADLAILKAAKVDADPAALLALLKKQSLAEGQREKVQQLIDQLGSTKFSVREKAYEELLQQGPAVVPLLRLAARNPDAEVAKRLQSCIQKLGAKMDVEVLSAILRTLAHKKPEGAIAAILDYAPSAPDAKVTREVWRTLATLARGQAKPDPLLAAALEAKDPARKTAAAAALGRDGKKPEAYLYPAGLKVAMKGTIHHDGKKWAEIEIVDLRFFDRLDDDNFAKP